MPKIIENVRERLLDVLEGMFLDDSCDISLRLLAQRADIAVGTIYNYFPDKDDLIKALFQREWSRTVSRILDAMDEVAAGATPPVRAVAPEEYGPATGAPAAAPEDRPAVLVPPLVTVMYNDVEKIARSHPRRRNLAHRISGNTEPYPLRPEGWHWLCTTFEPVWLRVAGPMVRAGADVRKPDQLHHSPPDPSVNSVASQSTPVSAGVDGKVPDYHRLTVTVVSTAHKLATTFPDARQANIDFLINLILHGGFF
jgi:AcrR family transcriptional regulator